MTEKILAERHLSKRDTLAETHFDLETLKKRQCVEGPLNKETMFQGDPKTERYSY